MNPARLAKIRALADDERGDPATRARAQEKLAFYRTSHPHLFREVKARPPPPDPRVHGMRRDPAYEYFIFSDLSLWDETKEGNKVITLYHKGVIYRIILFQHKKTNDWGWLRVNVATAQHAFSRRFATQGEAHNNSWASLMLL